MTRKILETLNLPTMEDVLGDNERFDDLSPLATDLQLNLPGDDELQALDHAGKMDVIHKQTLQHASDLVEHAYNAEPRQMRGIFEIATTMYGRAIEAANSKREAQLKTLRLKLDAQKLELETLRNKGDAMPGDAVATDAVIVFEDRNALLKRMIEQAQKPD